MPMHKAQTLYFSRLTIAERSGRPCETRLGEVAGSGRGLAETQMERID